MLESILLAVAALLPVVNPLGGAPIFLAMSADLPQHARRHLATLVGRNAFLLLAAATFAGSLVLRFFGISIPALRVAGGLVVLASGWRLLHARADDGPTQTAVTDAWERELARRAFYPLTFPLTVGPGSISIAVTVGAHEAPTRAAMAMFVVADVIAISVIALSVYLSYRYSSRLIASLGETGTSVFLRLSAFIMLCIGVTILWSGIAGLVATLPR
jgi:multiple antibiotic resistance protein